MKTKIKNLLVVVVFAAVVAFSAIADVQLYAHEPETEPINSVKSGISQISIRQGKTTRIDVLVFGYHGYQYPKNTPSDIEWTTTGGTIKRVDGDTAEYTTPYNDVGTFTVTATSPSCKLRNPEESCAAEFAIRVLRERPPVPIEPPSNYSDTFYSNTLPTATPYPEPQQSPQEEQLPYTGGYAPTTAMIVMMFTFALVMFGMSIWLARRKTGETQ